MSIVAHLRFYPLMTHLSAAEQAARKAGALLRENFLKDKDIDEAFHHDVKLALDRKSQDLITDVLLEAFPDYALYGEEGIAGNQDSDMQWIVDPIDGTVNYLYSIPHFCISIALRQKEEIIMGLIYDPMLDELWTVEKGSPAQLNGQPIACSPRDKLEESILFVGCGKDKEAMSTGLERFERASNRARKMRMMGSAALGSTIANTATATDTATSARRTRGMITSVSFMGGANSLWNSRCQGQAGQKGRS